MIYFIETQGLVKIGYSNDPKRRFQMLATGCPTKSTLVAVCEGDEADEKRLHSRFGSHKLRGEWFNFHQDIHEFIAENAIPYPVKELSGRRTDHPLTRHLGRTGKSLAAFARDLKMSRMQLYRIMNGESTTTGRLRLISEATGGAVPMSAFLHETGDAA